MTVVANRYLRFLHYLAGYLSLGLGVIGVFLPLMPTAPFVVLAAICFSRSSRRAHEWLRGLPVFGEILARWERDGSIRQPVKVAAITGMTISGAGVWFLSGAPTWARLVAIGALACAAAYVATRPADPSDG